VKTQIILALDVESFKKAKYWVCRLYPEIKIFKVGAQLFVASGPQIINFIRKIGGEVFLDLKFFDIPHTVAKAVAQAVRLKVKMLTLHIAGGREMLSRAVKAARQESQCLGLPRPRLLGITVLTSKEAKAQEVLKLTKDALDCGLDGVVCSAQEARLLRSKIRKKFLIVTPGIRPASAARDDQKRTATSQEAIRAGSNFLVVGRPILKATDPLRVLKELKC
jgi:orotidine-5'-phosphate decarboxylase